MLGVSRGTLRSALQRLEESGEIVRRQGSGTFVGRMAVPTAFGERLERLEPYSSVARRRGVSLDAVDVSVQRAAVRAEACEALGLEPDAHATVIDRTLVAGGTPVAVMYDVVHPSIELPEPRLLRELRRGRMVLDVLIELGVPITFARTRVEPRLLSGRERSGKQLQIRGATACLELEELIFAGRDDRVAYSRDLFAPGGIEVMVMRSLDSPAPRGWRPTPVPGPSVAGPDGRGSLAARPASGTRPLGSSRLACRNRTTLGRQRGARGGAAGYARGVRIRARRQRARPADRRQRVDRVAAVGDAAGERSGHP